MSAATNMVLSSAEEDFYTKIFTYASGGLHVPSLDSGRMEAVLRASKIPVELLKQVWDISDTQRNGSFNRTSFNIALKLIACAQNGIPITHENLNAKTPLPHIPGISGNDERSSFVHSNNTSLNENANSACASPTMVSWEISPEDMEKFTVMFKSMNPIDNKVTGAMVYPLLVKSQLPREELAGIWSLADVDRDGHLNREEFAIAMTLVNARKNGRPLLTSLPPSLISSSKRLQDSSAGNSVHGSPSTARASVSRVNNWVVTPNELAHSKIYFNQIDTDHDGYVSSNEAFSIFLASGLSHDLLARVWSVVDSAGENCINMEQFALCMYFIQAKLRGGIDPPTTLSADMVPPSKRVSGSDISSVGGGSSLSVSSLGGPMTSAPLVAPPTMEVPESAPLAVREGDFSSIQELDLLGKEIAVKEKERSELSASLTDREHTITREKCSIADLQKHLDNAQRELDALSAESIVAKERLLALDKEKDNLAAALVETQAECEMVQENVLQLRASVESSSKDLERQREDLVKSQGELEQLRREESSLLKDVKEKKVDLANLSEEVQSVERELASLKKNTTIVSSANGSSNIDVDQLQTGTDVFSEALLSESSAHATSENISQLVNGAGPFSFSNAFSERVTSDPFSRMDSRDATSVTSTSVDPFAPQTPTADSDKKLGGAFSFSDPFGEEVTSDPFSRMDSCDAPSMASASVDPFAPQTPTAPAADSSNSKSGTPNVFAFDEAPFPATGSNGGMPDPFAATSSVADGGVSFDDPFSSAATFSGGDDPFKTSGDDNLDLFKSDPLANANANGGDLFPSSSRADPFASSVKSDPFADPFASMSVTSDPFSNQAFGSSIETADPFASTDPFMTASAPTNEDSTNCFKGDPFVVDSFGDDEDAQLAWAMKESTVTFNSIEESEAL